MVILASVLFASLAASPIQWSVTHDGLQLAVNGVNIIDGSGFQFYAPGWTKGYFSSQYGDLDVQKQGENHYRVTIQDPNKECSGSEDFLLNGNQLKVTCDFSWLTSDPCLIELTAGQINGAAVLSSPYDANGQTGLHFGSAPDKTVSEGQRTLTQLLNPMTLNGAWGAMTLAPQPSGWTVFDARNWPQDWTHGGEYLWYGNGSIPIESGQPVHLNYSITINPTDVKASSPLVVTESMNPVKDASFLPNLKLPLVPFPKQQNFNSGKSLELTGAWQLPVGHFIYLDDFLSGLGLRYILGPITPKTPQVEIDGGLADLQLPPQAFTIKISSHGISVLGEDNEGLRNGLRRLPLLAYSQDGHVNLPVGTLTDWPNVKWRGFHLFGGPQSLPFEKKLVHRVLAPLGFNHAVIQCERTAWDSMPNVRGDDIMSKQQLAQLFDMYRGFGIDPIPLIASFGHAEWAFDNGGNLDLAYNRAQPYTLDPRKPGTKTLLQNLWKEAIGLLHPDAVHFGCDEVDMIGFPSGVDALTPLWKLQMPILGDIAQANHVRMMVWGDEMLAKGEAPDACNAPSAAVARERRKALPAGATVADWHYANNADINAYLPTISLWKQAGIPVIASTWYEANNVAGFDAAAAQSDAGTLQTTWCGYTVNAQTAAENLDQFAAFVLASEYSWSGRQDPPDQLGYNYRNLFWHLFFQGPLDVQPKAGFTASDGTSGFTVGRYRFGGMEPLGLTSLLDPKIARMHESGQIVLKNAEPASEIVLANYCKYATKVGNTVAHLTIHFSNGEVLEKDVQFGYQTGLKGGQIPATEAENGNGQFAFVVDLGGKKVVESVSVEAVDTSCGFTINGVTLLK